MKKIFLILLFLLLSIFTYSQNNFQWEIIDSCSKSKEQIYSETKMFIANMWKSAQNVIQNDDKEAGMILIKCSSYQLINYRLGNYTWGFDYTVAFYMKNNKFKINLYNVIGSSAPSQTPLMQIDYYRGYNKTLQSEKQYLQICSQLKLELQSIIDDYIKEMKSPLKQNNW